MAEAEKTETNGQEQQGTQATEEKKGDDTVTIRKGEYSGLKTQLRQLQKQLDEYNAGQKEAEAQKLKAAADWETLEKKKNAELDAMKTEIASMRRSVITERARSAIRAAGMNADLAVEGALSTLPQEIEPDGIGAWVDSLKAAHPAAFAPPVVPIGAPSAGPTGKPTTDVTAALKAEWDASKAKGPDAMQAVHAKIKAHVAQGGKDPRLG